MFHSISFLHETAVSMVIQASNVIVEKVPKQVGQAMAKDVSVCSKQCYLNALPPLFLLP
jgi:hypothetical protein